MSDQSALGLTRPAGAPVKPRAKKYGGLLEALGGEAAGLAQDYWPAAAVGLAAPWWMKKSFGTIAPQFGLEPPITGPGDPWAIEGSDGVFPVGEEGSDRELRSILRRGHAEQLTETMERMAEKARSGQVVEGEPGKGPLKVGRQQPQPHPGIPARFPYAQESGVPDAFREYYNLMHPDAPPEAAHKEWYNKSIVEDRPGPPLKTVSQRLSMNPADTTAWIEKYRKDNFASLEDAHRAYDRLVGPGERWIKSQPHWQQAAEAELGRPPTYEESIMRWKMAPNHPDATEPDFARAVKNEVAVQQWQAKWKAANPTATAAEYEAALMRETTKRGWYLRMSMEEKDPVIRAAMAEREQNLRRDFEAKHGRPPSEEEWRRFRLRRPAGTPPPAAQPPKQAPISEGQRKLDFIEKWLAEHSKDPIDLKKSLRGRAEDAYNKKFPQLTTQQLLDRLGDVPEGKGPTKSPVLQPGAEQQQFERDFAKRAQKWTFEFYEKHGRIPTVAESEIGFKDLVAEFRMKAEDAPMEKAAREKALREVGDMDRRILELREIASKQTIREAGVSKALGAKAELTRGQRLHRLLLGGKGSTSPKVGFGAEVLAFFAAHGGMQTGRSGEPWQPQKDPAEIIMEMTQQPGDVLNVAGEKPGERGVGHALLRTLMGFPSIVLDTPGISRPLGTAGRWLNKQAGESVVFGSKRMTDFSPPRPGKIDSVKRRMTEDEAQAALKKLGPSAQDVIFLSRFHSRGVGGFKSRLKYFLKKKKESPASFAQSLKYAKKRTAAGRGPRNE